MERYEQYKLLCYASRFFRTGTLVERDSARDWALDSSARLGIPMTSVEGREKPKPHQGIIWNEKRLLVGASAYGSFASRRDMRALKQAVDYRLLKLSPVRPGPTEQSMRMIATIVGLSEPETEVLGFCVRYHELTLLQSLIDGFRKRRNTGLRADTELFRSVLDLPPRVLSASLSSCGRLANSGLIEIDNDGGSIKVMEVVRRIVSERCRSVEAVRSRLLGMAGKSDLHWSDFRHVAKERDYVCGILRGALRSKAPGINVLVYGPPGTGKTEFCRIVARKLGVPLYLPGAGNRSDPGIEWRDRVIAAKFSQHVLRTGGPALILFDEMEDALEAHMSDYGGYRRRGTGITKLAINHLLENSPIPMLWTANSIEMVPDYLLRRMTHIMELRVPPTDVRTRVWRRVLKRQDLPHLFDAAQDLAKQFKAAPGIADAAVRAAKLAGGGRDEIKRSVGNLDKVLNGRLRHDAHTIERYNPALTNADGSLLNLEKKLVSPQAKRNFSLCLYGPPGTGKSAWVRHLAGRLRMEVRQHRASDLLSMWVGGTEKSIAGAFEEAKDNEEFLVFDEADSFLQDREQAVRSWEITAVNEMLTQMESHPLPFACTTNLLDHLDRASLRRFTFKIRFDYLMPEQIRGAFITFFGLEAPPDALRLTTLTPGDFAVVRRRAEVLGALNDPAQLTVMLSEECEVKGQQGSIGFRTGK